MKENEKRKRFRSVSALGVKLYKSGEKFPAILIDAAPGGIGVISAAGIFPGSSVAVTFDGVEDYSFHGTVRWSQIITQGGRTRYRLGIEAGQILLPESILKRTKKETD